MQHSDPDRADEAIQDLAVRGGGERPVKDPLLVLEVPGAHEVEPILAPASAGCLAGDDEVHVRLVGEAHPVHPADFGAEVLGPAAARRAVQEDAGPYVLERVGQPRRLSGGGPGGEGN